MNFVDKDEATKVYIPVQTWAQCVRKCVPYCVCMQFETDIFKQRLLTRIRHSTFELSGKTSIA